nr:DUF637 domain-containing protein [Pseudomonas quasicaspiana]
MNAGSLENQGTLSAAEYVTINTGELLNEGGLIFSGADMELRGTKVTNRFGDIYSMGDLAIAKNAAGDRAQVIENISGTLESAGDMSLSADAVTNRKDVLTLANKRVNAYITHSCAHCSDEWNVWYYVNEIYERTVTEDSASAFMTIGGNLTVTGTSFLNQYSSVSAVKDIDITVDDFKNEGTTLATITYRAHYRNPADQEPGSIYLGLIDPGGAVNEFNKYSAKYVPLYRRADGSYFYQQESGLSTTLNPDYDPTKNMPVPTAVTRYGVFSATQVTTPGKSIDAVIQSGGDTTIIANDEFNNSIQKVSAPIVTSDSQVDASGALQATTPFIAQLNTQLPADLAQQQVDPLTLPGFVIPDRENGLFRLSSGPTSQNIPDANGQVTPHKYLIETNSALTDLKQFMSSDYLLDKLGYDPALSAKRLGDGLYEQRLIQQAIVARTGQRFIDGQTSDEAQFKYLMNNAAARKDALNLSVGVTLTAEQVAALTDDIVWMEEREVQGEKVLVPVLYLAQADNRLAPTGALIAGNNVSLASGANLENVGTLRASNNLSALSGKDLINSGLMQANARLDALATNNIANQAGGIIKGNDVSITSLFDSVLNERTVTTYAGSNTSGKGNWNWSQDFVDNAARIEAGNTLGINAAGDFTSVGSVLSSGADMKIDAGGSVNILSTQQNNRIADGESHDDSTIRQHASQVIAGGALTVNADNDITAVASQIEAKTDVTLTAGKNLTLASAADEDHSYTKGSSITRQEDHVRQVAATVKAGGDVKLSATEDLTMIASRIAAGDEASLIAGKDLNILAAQNSDYTLFDMKKEGGFGSKETQRDEVTQITHVGSEITTGGNLTLKSTGDQLYQASKLDSGKDLTIDSGGAITFEGVKDLHQESHEKSNSDAFWMSSSGKGNTDETLRQTQMVAKGNLVIKAVDGLHIDVKQVNQQTVTETIDAMVKADPQLAWLKDAEKRGDVDWRQVKEIHSAFQYSNSGLGPASQIIIAIIMAVFVGPAAAGALGGVGTGVGAAVGAVATGAATNATVSFINNGGDLGSVFKDVTSSDALKSYAISGITAGVGTVYFDAWTGMANGPQLGTLPGIGDFALNQALQNTTSTLLGKALGQGGDISDALKGALFNTLAAASFNAVGDYTMGKFADGTPQKVVIHAMVGGLLSEISGGNFVTGALAAGASEALSSELSALVGSTPALKTMVSQIIGVLAASTQKDADTGTLQNASWVAKNGAEYNRHLHSEEDKWLRANAKRFADDQGISEQRALEILSQQALKDVDYLWRALLSDGNDLAAQKFLSHSGSTFINEQGEQQPLFTTRGNQLMRPEMFADTADPVFYRQFVQSGVARELNAGLYKELQDSGIELKDGSINLAKAFVDQPAKVVEGLYEGILELPSTLIEGFYETGTAIGEGAAVALTPELTDKLNAIYGVDVEAGQRTLLLIRTVMAISGAGTAGKIGSDLAEALAGAIGKKLDNVLVETKAYPVQTVAGSADNEAGIAGSSLRKVELGKFSSQIEDDLNSPTPGAQLEGQVGKALSDAGVLLDYQSKIRREFVDGKPSGVGEIDAETPNFIIEISSSRKPNKTEQLLKLQNNTLLNPERKEVVLFAPKVTSSQQLRAYERIGIKVVNNIDDLVSYGKSKGGL